MSLDYRRVRLAHNPQRAARTFPRYRRRVRSVAISALVCALAAACSTPAVEYGKELYSDPGFARAQSNVFSCATCHEAVAPATLVRPGYTLLNATRRPSYWGGKLRTALEASSQCVTGFMAGNPLTADDEAGRALFLYLQSLSSAATADALPLSVVADIVDVPSGDATRGKALYDGVCQICHGDANTGAGRLGPLNSVIPDETLAEHGTDPFTGARLRTIEKVRHGKYFDIGGRMPLFSLEALSDVQLGDILAYLEQKGLPASGVKR